MAQSESYRFRYQEVFIRTPHLNPPLTVGEDFFWWNISRDIFDNDLADDLVGILSIPLSKSLYSNTPPKEGV